MKRIPTVTVCLLNWRRPENLYRIIPALRTQTVKPHIFLWDNAPECMQHFDVDWVVRSSENQRCWPRWFMASQAVTDYVVSWDDDLIPADDTFLYDLCKVMEASDHERDRAYGIEGVIIREGLSYEQSNNVGVPREHFAVDIVKGRVLAMPQRAVKALRMYPAPEIDEDDIAVSAILADFQADRHNRVVHLLRKRVENLGAAHAISADPFHYARRDRAMRDWFLL